MKIVKLEAENIKRLTAVEISPDGAVIKISGKNAAGKTSVLDTIWWAMGGGDNIQDQPIRQGAETGNIKLDLGDLKVERRFTDKGSSLYVTNADGARYPSPQAVLDKLVGTLSFDPLEFMRLKPKEQFSQLREIVSIGDELDALDLKRKGAFDNRTDINRLVKEKAGAVKNNPVDPKAPDQVVSAAELLDKIQAAEQVNQNNQKIDDAFGRAKVHEMSMDGEVNRLEAAIKDRLPVLEETMKSKIAELKKEFDQQKTMINDDLNEKRDLRKAAVKATADLGGQVNNLTNIDVAPMRTELSGIEDKNNAARIKQTAIALQTSLDDLSKQAGDLTSKIHTLDNDKAKLMATAEFPTDGLTFLDGEVMYNDLPLAQASAAEQLRVSMSIAMSANPEFRVIRITDGSLMDSDSFKLIEKMAEDHDYQIWVEVVDESGEVGIVIEDGAVVKVN